MLIRQCPENASLGTNMDESYHLVFWRNFALKCRKSFNTPEMEIDMTARHFSHGVLVSQFIPSNDVGPDNEASVHAHKRRHRICRSNVSIKVIAFALHSLAQGGSQDFDSDLKRLFFTKQASSWPGMDYASVQALGFGVRISYVYSDLVGYQTSDIRLLWTITPNPRPPPPPQHPFYPPPPVSDFAPPPVSPQYQTCPIVTTPLRCRSGLWSRA